MVVRFSTMVTCWTQHQYIVAPCLSSCKINFSNLFHTIETDDDDDDDDGDGGDDADADDDDDKMIRW